MTYMYIVVIQKRGTHVSFNTSVLQLAGISAVEKAFKEKWI